MAYGTGKRHRRSIRLKGYDYSQEGAYFLTVCTQGRLRLFGDIIAGEMELNAAGRMVRTEWDALPQRFPTAELDAFVVMPNHIHGIIVIHNVAPPGATSNPDAPVGAGLVPARDRSRRPDGFLRPGGFPRPDRSQPLDGTTMLDRATTRVAPTVGDIVGAFKSRTTVAYGRGVRQLGWPPFDGRVWQRNYYEHIIHDDASLARIRRYIRDNPMQWADDPYNPNAQAFPDGHPGAGYHRSLPPPLVGGREDES